MNKKILFDQLRTLTTETRNPRSKKIDLMSIPDILRVINNEDRKVAMAVAKEIPYIAKGVQLVVDSLKGGGRLIYVGAGTSGRLGVLDASECPPTFGTDPGMVLGIIAGGAGAVFQSHEGSEDNESEGKLAIIRKKVGANDVVCGIAASMRTPFVIGAITAAKKRRAKTIYVTANSRDILKQPRYAQLRKALNVAICLEVGPEVIMGSTRMKSGTAQKLVLNMITTAAMIRLGKVYENMMIDLRMNSRKLEERAKRILMISTGIDYENAEILLEEAAGNVKTAIVMAKKNVSLGEARKLLYAHNGFVRKAIGGK
ncbi:MAG: N-acetylmuramic acid 6-phosphate etherase [Bacteroidota bacterium]